MLFAFVCWLLSPIVIGLTHILEFGGLGFFALFEVLVWLCCGVGVLSVCIYKCLMTKRLSWLLVAPAGVLAGIGLCCATVQVARGFGFGRHPTTDEVEAEFLDHRAEFEELREMILEDVASGRLREDVAVYVRDLPFAQLPKDRARDYVRLCRETGLRYFLPDTLERSLKFTVSTQGFSVSGSSVSIVYVAGHPPDFDQQKDADRFLAPYDRMLEPGWFVIRRSW